MNEILEALQLFLLQKRTQGRRGSFIVLTAIGSVFLIGLTAMVTDVGWLYYNKARIQTAVDAGWKAGMDRAVELGGMPLSSTNQALVRARIQEVAQMNWPDGLTTTVTFAPDNNSFAVSAAPPVGLMFARVINFNSANVGAARASEYLGGEGIIPLGVPWGVTKDIDKTTYNVTFFNTNASEAGFIPGLEYVIKLGGSEPGEDANAISRLLVPMDAGAQPNDLAYKKAYGVAHWALGQENFVPVEWLIGYRGGAFMFRYYTDPAIEAAKKYSILKKRLTDRGVNCQELTSAQANAIYDAVDAYVPPGKTTNIIQMSYQPYIKMVSSSDPDPVGTIMRAAEIPYGGTGTGNNWVPYTMGLTDTYNTAKCNVYWDDAVLNGDLMYGAHWLHIHHEKFADTAGNEGKVSDAIADAHGYTAKVSGGITFPKGVVGKQEMVYKIREFAAAGKMLYTQCAATDNMDAALWMRRLRINSADPTPYADCIALTDFNYVTYSKGVQKTGWPVAMDSNSFEKNTKAAGTGNYTLTNKYDPRQQDHNAGAIPSFTGNTSSFNASFVRSIDKYPSTTNPVDILARNGDGSVRYMSGKVKGASETGEFAFMGGHESKNIYTERLTLNNVLLGSLIAEKLAIGGGGKKVNFGIIDPTNIASGSTASYAQRLMYGFNQTLNANERILPLPGNATDATTLGLNYLFSISSYPRVILPITDLGPEILANAHLASDTATNASATSIYDLRGQDNPNGVTGVGSYTFKSAVRIIGFAEFELVPLIEADPARIAIIGATQDGQIRARFIRYIVKPYTDVTPQ